LFFTNKRIYALRFGFKDEQREAPSIEQEIVNEARGGGFLELVAQRV